MYIVKLAFGLANSNGTKYRQPFKLNTQANRITILVLYESQSNFKQKHCVYLFHITHFTNYIFHFLTSLFIACRDS